MLKERNILFWTLALAVFLASLTATFAQRASTPKAQDKYALGEADVKQLLLLMDTDKNGKISKVEYMNFMAKEFDRLDKDKSGELDPQELTQSRLRASHIFSTAGK
jgi:Ca2+-binding EF-hand superfamily protein